MPSAAPLQYDNTVTAPLTVVSGGQTGVDRAALDAALAARLPCGGWCPKGRAAEDGPIPPRYRLRETRRTDPAFRTRLNVRDSDATLIIARGPLSGGTELTARHANRLSRPCLVVDLDRPEAPGLLAARIAGWVRANAVSTLNVAGPRESSAPGIQQAARALLDAVFALLV